MPRRADRFSPMRVAWVRLRFIARSYGRGRPARPQDVYMATGRAGIAWAGLLMMIAGGIFAYALHLGVLPVRVDMWHVSATAEHH